MEITILVGNGFDLGLGLHTKYTDFLEQRYLRVAEPRDSLIGKFHQEISKDAANWGDAEMAFAGLGFSKFDENAEAAFLTVEEDFHFRLNEYLRDEESRLVIPKEDQDNVSVGFAEAIRDLFLKLAEGPRRMYVNAITSGVRHNLNFIDFNYTSTLETIIGDCQYGRELCSIQASESRKIIFSLGHIVHVHGDLQSGNTIFGVCASEQIKDDALRRASQSEGYFIKRKLDSLVGENRGDVGLDLLRRSDVIVTFGLSFGESDLGWWDTVLSCMSSNSRLSIVMCPYRTSGPLVRTQNGMLHERASEWRRFRRGFPNGYRNDVFEGVKGRSHVVLLGNHKAPDGVIEYCDPLCLKWIGRRYVKGYVDRDKEILAVSTNPIVTRAISRHNQRINSI